MPVRHVGRTARCGPSGPSPPPPPPCSPLRRAPESCEGGEGAWRRPADGAAAAWPRRHRRARSHLRGRYDASRRNGRSAQWREETLEGPPASRSPQACWLRHLARRGRPERWLNGGGDDERWVVGSS